MAIGAKAQREQRVSRAACARDMHESLTAHPTAASFSLLASSLEEAERASVRAPSSGRRHGADGHKRARNDGGWWTTVSDGTGVPDAMCVAIAQRIDALKTSSARAGLPAAALQDAMQCLVQAARLGLGSEHTTRLLWCLRPRETIQQSTMAQLLNAMTTSLFSSALITQGLRWLLLMLQDDGIVVHVNPGVTEDAQATEDSAGAAVSRGQGDAGASSLACMITKLLRPLYRVIFHMLIAAYSCTADSLQGARGCSGAEASFWPASAADRALLCQILLKITSRREARACWLQIALVLACLYKRRQWPRGFPFGLAVPCLALPGLLRAPGEFKSLDRAARPNVPSSLADARRAWRNTSVRNARRQYYQ